MLSLPLSTNKILQLEDALRVGDSILIEGLWNSTKALIASLAEKATGKHIVILTGASLEEVSLYHDFAAFTDRPILDFPAWEALPSEKIPPSPDIVGERYKTLETIHQNPHQSYIILTSLQAALQLLISPKNFQSMNLLLKKGATYNFKELTEKLYQMGYQKKAVATDKGEFAVRGGIIDIFPVSSPDPFRLEFWDNDLESIRVFDPVGQKSVREVEQISLTCALELEMLEKREDLSTLFDYLGKNTLVVFDDLVALEDRYASLINIEGQASKVFCSLDDLFEKMQNLQKIYLSSQSIEELSEIKIKDDTSKNVYFEKSPPIEIEFEMFNRKLLAKRWFHPFQPIDTFLEEEEEGIQILKTLMHFQEGTWQIHILTSTELEKTAFLEKLIDAKIELTSKIHFHMGYLSQGFSLAEMKTFILPLTEMTHRYKIRRQKMRSTYHTTPIETFDLSPGENVVHLNNGIGKYLGIEKRPDANGHLGEFFSIEYAEHAKLFVPIQHSYLLTKYIGSGEESPKLHTLGSNRWKKTKDRTQQAILGYASDLLDLYAKREMHGGFSYSPDSLELASFEEDFAFVETEDQLSAILAIKQDMTSPKAMDRLVCGDVGYGKTEVAMRAAFKAVVDGKKQVAVLVPTTVLAMQHYENFKERMANFPINVGVLSRFVSAKEERETLEGVATGKIDILIGTHRIIGDDVIFQDLGLCIIDEEQRFGVKAKEHLKKIKVGVDCLTLSATPIPRTLYMSLVGARDMSVINTPPQDRLPIKTVITEPNEITIKNALLRELTRDGQAYVIHNRVETIYEMADRLKKLVPQAKIVVGHGQMSSHEIDSVFHAFKSGRANILVATTIVENGIDIPNANTILIDRADTFGLADLYQLRGRVGRWNRRAYAYFLVPRIERLPEITRKRMQALAESTGYGGGMRIALRDLEIRGAGDILGLDQSGHVSSIGFHLYCKMLKRTIKTLQGKLSAAVTDTKIDYPMDARLTEDYVNEVSLRMEIYQRLGEAVSWEELTAIWEEVIDRFGSPPPSALWLYHMSRIRVFASINGITSIKFEKVPKFDVLTMTFEKQKGEDSITKKQLVSAPQDPAGWEPKIIEALGSV